MKQYTIQEQYNLLNEGKLAKDVFIKEAKRKYPQYITNHANLTETLNSLKYYHLISEDTNHTPKESLDFFQIFNEHIEESSGDNQSLLTQVSHLETSPQSDKEYVNMLVKLHDSFGEGKYSRPKGYKAELPYVDDNEYSIAGLLELAIDFIIHPSIDGRDSDISEAEYFLRKAKERATEELVNENIKEGYMGKKGDVVKITKAGSKSIPHYVLEKPDGSAQVDMTFDSKEEAKKYANKKQLKLNESKSVEKNTPKEVTDIQDKNFDYKDPKNIDNVFGEQFLKGYYCEMKDPKNAEKTIEEIKDIVAKNLAKDRLHYVKDGQFGVKGIGYTDELPGLKASKSDQMEKVKLKENYSLNENQYPKSQYKWDTDHPYSFTIYVDGGDKHHTDYYDLESAKQMKKVLDSKGEVYKVMKSQDGQYTDEVTSLRETIFDFDMMSSRGVAGHFQPKQQSGQKVYNQLKDKEDLSSKTRKQIDFIAQQKAREMSNPGLFWKEFIEGWLDDTGGDKYEFRSNPFGTIKPEVKETKTTRYRSNSINEVGVLAIGGGVALGILGAVAGYKVFNFLKNGITNTANSVASKVDDMVQDHLTKQKMKAHRELVTGALKRLKSDPEFENYVELLLSNPNSGTPDMRTKSGKIRVKRKDDYNSMKKLRSSTIKDFKAYLEKNLNPEEKNVFKSIYDASSQGKSRSLQETKNMRHRSKTVRNYRSKRKSLMDLYESLPLGEKPAPKKAKPKKETTDSKLSEIESNGKIATLELQINALDEIIEGKSKRITMVTEDGDLSELVDKKKIKEMQREVNILTKRKDKMVKTYEKLSGSKYQKVVTDTKTDVDTAVDKDEDMDHQDALDKASAAGSTEFMKDKDMDHQDALDKASAAGSTEFMKESRRNYRYSKPKCGCSLTESSSKYSLEMKKRGKETIVHNKKKIAKDGSYAKIAKISQRGKITYYDDKIPSTIKKAIEAEAEKNVKKKAVKENEEGYEFIPHGFYSVSNAGGYEIMIDDDNEVDPRAMIRDTVTGETSHWLDIIYDENGDPIIDPQDYNIPLDQVMRIH